MSIADGEAEVFLLPVGHCQLPKLAIFHLVPSSPAPLCPPAQQYSALASSV
jgi:hypothetical protein